MTNKHEVDRYTGLSEMEGELITESIKRDITGGLLGTGLKWSIDYEKHDWEDEDDIYYIAGLIKKGYTSGVYPSWTLNIERENEEKEMV